MEQREKLIEIINNSGYFLTTEDVADYLLANGVVVLPGNASVIEWHEVKTRPLTNEEKEYYAELDCTFEDIFDCKMPEDGQEILISTRWGVDKDVCSVDAYYGVGLEGRGDWDGVYAWAEMPTYEKRKGGE